MAKIVAGIGLSHVPSVGPAHDRGKQQDPAWKPLFDAYIPVREWLAKLKPDVAIVVYNDHVADFSFDKYPTFALGAADSYPIADEGFGTRPLPEVAGDAEFSTHLCESLIEQEFDLTVCQEMGVEHGFLVPMNLCFPHTPGGLAGEERAAADQRRAAPAAHGATLLQARPGPQECGLLL